MTEAEKLAALCAAKAKQTTAAQESKADRPLTRDDLKSMTQREISEAFDAGKLDALLKGQ